MSGEGSTLGAAVDLAKFVIGVNTTTNSNTTGNSSSNSSVNTDVVNDSTTKTHSDQATSSTTVSNSETDTSNLVQNSTDPGVVSMLRQLAQTAIGNSSDPGKTSGLLSGIIQQAGDAMTSIFGAQRNSGLYNSEAARSQSNDVLSRASADAASAILGYQTGQQQIADTALNQLGNFLSSVFTTGKSITNSSSGTATVVASDVLSTTQDHASTNVQGQTNQTSQSQTQSSSKQGGFSVVCTWMYNNHMLPARKYYIATADLGRMHWYTQKGYLTFAAPLVRTLKTDHTNAVSRAIISIFTARTNQICALRDPRGGCKKSLYGAFARFIVASLCFPFCLYYFGVHIKNFLLGRDPSYGVEIY